MKESIYNFFIAISHSANELKMLIYGLFVYLQIDAEMIQILTSLMLIDTVFGAVKVLRINYKEFSFKALLIGFSAKMLFLLIPLVIGLIGKIMGYDFKILIDKSIIILALSEGFSIFGNAIAIKTKQEPKNYDIITKFLKIVRGFFINLANTFVKTVNTETEKNQKEEGHE